MLVQLTQPLAHAPQVLLHLTQVALHLAHMLSRIGRLGAALFLLPIAMRHLYPPCSPGFSLVLPKSILPRGQAWRIPPTHTSVQARVEMIRRVLRGRVGDAAH